eukprot:scaffold92546_cov48-Prasinocladus_malaysianus.AAC.1
MKDKDVRTYGTRTAGRGRGQVDDNTRTRTNKVRNTSTQTVQGFRHFELRPLLVPPAVVVLPHRYE